MIAAQINLLDRFFTTQERLEDMVAERTRELEEQKARLKVALDKERELNGLQRQFVSMVSHEFRTPLAIIDGNAQRIIRRHDKIAADRLLDGLGTIRTSVVRLTNLIESVLSAARLENGDIEFKPEPFELASMIEEVCDGHREINPGYRITTRLKELPKEARIDGMLMRQVVSNLISNAIKYSPEGTSIRVEGTVVDGDRVHLAVRDEGPGIPSAELGKLFDRFYRASTSTGIIGTGIGLHIVQVLVELHGGIVRVDSTEGEGSTFTVELPLKGSPDTRGGGTSPSACSQVMA